jgi:hypothetical protein
MKVAIVSTPRTCSSLLTDMFSKKYNLQNLSEIFSSCNSEQDAIDVNSNLFEQDNYVVKLTSTSFRTFASVIPYEKFRWSMFDKIVLAERQVIENQYASWILLSHAQRQGKRNLYEINEYIQNLLDTDLSTFHISPHTIHHIKTDISFYYDTLKPYLLSQNLPTHIITHETFQEDIDMCIDTVNFYLQESFTKEHISESTKSAIDYSKFISDTNLLELMSM